MVMLMAQRDVVHDGLRAVNLLEINESAGPYLGEVMIFAVVIGYELQREPERALERRDRDAEEAPKKSHLPLVSVGPFRDGRPPWPWRPVAVAASSLRCSGRARSARTGSPSVRVETRRRTVPPGIRPSPVLCLRHGRTLPIAAPPTGSPAPAAFPSP